MRRCLPLLLVLGAVGCDPQTIVTTTVTAPTPVTYTTPATTTTPGASCPTCPVTTTPCGTVGATCTGTGTPGTQRAPDIDSFGAETSRIYKGAFAILRWSVPDFAATVRIDPGVGSVSTTGFVLVFPTSTTTYTLTARNNFGVAQRTFTVVVTTPE